MPAGMRIAAVVLCALFLFAQGAYSQEKWVIKEVRLEGLERANEQFVRLKIRSKPGDEYSRDVAGEDIRNLVASGDFTNVTEVTLDAATGGAADESTKEIVLVYVFEESPLVRDVSFTGNESISRKRLEKKMKPEEEKRTLLQRISVPGAPPLIGSIYRPAEIERGVGEIREYYEQKGYFAASVRHVADVDEATSEAAVAIAIEEGPRGFIEEIKIVGNEVVSEKSIRKAMKTAERKKILPFIFGSGKLKRYELDEDLDRIAALYEEKGYLDIAVRGARCTKCGAMYRPLQGDPEHDVLPGTEFENVREDWVCPSCGAGKDAFERLGVELTVQPEGKTIRMSSPWENLLDKLGREWPVPSKKRKIELTVTLFEGPQYVAGKFSFRGNQVLSSKELLAACSLKEGSPFDIFALERDRTALYDKYGERGYIDAVVALEKAPTETPRVLDVVFSITENEQVRIGKIEITGNLITKDKVIRREIVVHPGEVFDMRRVRTSVQRIRGLDYWEYRPDPATGMPVPWVVPYDRPTDVEGVRDLVIEVKERPTGRIAFGGGVGSEWGVTGYFAVMQSNFDWKRWRSPFLRGAGQKARLRAMIGTRRTDVIASFTEPWLFDRPLSLGFDVFRTDKRYDKHRDEPYYYEQTNTGFDVELFKKLTPVTRAGVTYRLEEVDIDVGEMASEVLQKEGGETMVSSLRFEVRRDTIDSWLMPTRGMSVWGAWEVAGSFLGSEAEFLKHDYGIVQYIRLHGKKHVLRLTGRVAFAEEFGDSEDVPIFERFFLGGLRTIRGFKYRRVGPKDEIGKPIGGKSSLLLSAEYDYPIYGPLGGAVFYDTGNVWYDSYDIDLSDLRAGAGVGLRIRLEVMGAPVPINLDYGWPIDRDEWTDKSGRFHFSMGFNF